MSRSFAIVMIIAAIAVSGIACQTRDLNSDDGSVKSLAPLPDQGSGSTPVPTATPTPIPTATPQPTASPTPVPTSSPTPRPTANPTPVPTSTPTPAPQPTGTPAPNPGSFSSECTDQIDNDGDGVADFNDSGATAGAYMGCFGPNAQESMRDYGFTIFPAPPSDAKIFYVSAGGVDPVDAGNPNGAGESPDRPLKTIEMAINLTNRRSWTNPNVPDWILLKRGESFTVSTELPWGNNSGRSETARKVLGSYGTSMQRPKIYIASGIGMQICCTSVAHVAFVGLHFIGAQRDPHAADFSMASAAAGPTGIRVVTYSGGGDLLFEDNIFEYLKEAAAFDVQGPRLDGVTFHRNIIRNDYGVAPLSSSAPGGRDYFPSRSQGIYVAGTNNLMLRDNLFYHNGWNADVAGGESSIYSHNIYVADGNGPAVAMDNIIALGASHGLQLRCGGQILNNAFLRNAIATFTRTSPGTVQDNVVLDGKDIQAGPNAGQRGWGIELQQGVAQLAINNIVAQKPNLHGEGSGFAFKTEDSGALVRFEGNIDYNWAGPSVENGQSSTYVSNWFQDLNPVNIFPDPNRTVQTYYNNILHPGASIDSDQALQKFLDEAAAARSRFGWDQRYAADTFNRYIREGFGR